MEGWTDGRVEGWKGGGLDGWAGQREGKAKDDGNRPFPAVPSDKEAEFPLTRSVPIAPS